MVSSRLATDSVIQWAQLSWIKKTRKKVLYRTRDYILGPAAPYELQGDVPNVVFPCAALQDGKRVAVYYGAADTVVGMAFGYIDEIIEFVKTHSI